MYYEYLIRWRNRFKPGESHATICTREAGARLQVYSCHYAATHILLVRSCHFLSQWMKQVWQNSNSGRLTQHSFPRHHCWQECSCGYVLTKGWVIHPTLLSLILMLSPSFPPMSLGTKLQSGCRVIGGRLILAYDKGKPELLLWIIFLHIPLVVCQSEINASKSNSNLMQHVYIMHVPYLCMTLPICCSNFC